MTGCWLRIRSLISPLSGAEKKANRATGTFVRFVDAKILRNQTINTSHTTRKVFFFEKLFCSDVWMTHHSSVPTQKRAAHSLWLFGRYQMGTDLRMHQLHSDANVKLKFGLLKQQILAWDGFFPFTPITGKGKFHSVISLITGHHLEICSARYHEIISCSVSCKQQGLKMTSSLNHIEQYH